MTCADAMMAERAAWRDFMRAAADAISLQADADALDSGPTREHAVWNARRAAVRAGTCRERWNQASEALAEAAANRSARSSAMTPTA